MIDKPIVDLASLDQNAVLTLNNASASETSLMSADDLRCLVSRSVYARAVGPAAAMLIALDQAADYDSPNYLWLRNRLDLFVYVDRIIVSEAARGLGLGARLYTDLASWAGANGHVRIVCEVNTDPDNPASHAFHVKRGFRPIGDARHGPDKAVRFYQLDV